MFAALIACLLLIAASALLVLAVIVRTTRLERAARADETLVLRCGNQRLEIPRGSTARRMLPKRLMNRW
jgi:hypothetical protein